MLVNSTNRRPDRRPEDRRDRDRRAARRPARRARRFPYGGGGNTKAYARGFQEAAGALPRIHPAEAERRADTFASAIRIVEPVHRAEVEDDRRALRRLGRHASPTTSSMQAWRCVGREEGIFCEPRVRGRNRGRSRASAAKPGERVVCVHHRPRAEGPGRGREARRMTIHVRAPATSANLGAGFDVAAVALRLLERADRRGGERLGPDPAPTRRTSASARSRATPRRRSGRSASSTGSRASAASARAPPSSRSGSSRARSRPGRSRPPTSCSRKGSSSKDTPTTWRPPSSAASA